MQNAKNLKTMICSKCQFDGKGNDCCLSCKSGGDYSFNYRQYVFDPSDAAQPDTSGSEKCTHLSEEDEDRLRIALCNMFSLKPLELLCLQAIMNGESLKQFADDVTSLVEKNRKGCTRFHAFQLRKSLMAKIPSFADALLTNGQRKAFRKPPIWENAGNEIKAQ